MVAALQSGMPFIAWTAVEDKGNGPDPTRPGQPMILLLRTRYEERVDHQIAETARRHVVLTRVFPDVLQYPSPPNQSGLKSISPTNAALRYVRMHRLPPAKAQPRRSKMASEHGSADRRGIRLLLRW